MKLSHIIVAALLCLPVRSAEFDLLIRGGRMVDGTGAPAVQADVGIKRGKVARVGKFPSASARKVIDAPGMIVAPGFIDVHTHAEDIVELPEAPNFIRMGVTTLILGNCGASVVSRLPPPPNRNRPATTCDLDPFFTKIEKMGVAPNIATLIGHNTVRRIAMGGSFDRAPSAAELERMKQLVDEGMKDGAVGLSTGLIYLPGTFSKTEEIIELARVAAKHGGIYVSHMRDEGLEIEAAIDEVIRIAREARIRAHISHIKLSGKSAWNRAERILEKIEAARREGIDITQDQYVYTASSTGIAQLVPEWAREGDGLGPRLRNPETAARIREEMRSRLARRGFDDFSYAVIAQYNSDTSLNGLNIAEAASKKLGSPALENQIELILQVVNDGGASGVFHGIGEEDLRVFLQHPNTMFAADSGVRRYQQGVPHPRGYGNNARVLHRYVNELKLIRLEEAIRRMTSLPANVFALPHRGQIYPGFHADIVIFNPARIRDRATFTQPHQYPEGIEYVLVNGEIVLEKSEPTKIRPGQIIRLGGDK